MERVIDCPVCFDTDNCFEDIQENYNSYLCFHCGFMSDSRYQLDSLETIENMKNAPKLVREIKYEDKERNIYWYASVINMGKLCIIYPEGEPDKYVWKYAKIVDVPEEQRAIYENHTQRLDIENAESYSKYDFMSACKAMGITERLDNA